MSSKQDVPSPHPDPHGSWSSHDPSRYFLTLCLAHEANQVSYGALDLKPVGSSQRLVGGPPFEADSLARRSLLLAETAWGHPRLGHQNGAHVLIWGDSHIDHKMKSGFWATNSLPPTLGLEPAV